MRLSFDFIALLLVTVLLLVTAELVYGLLPLALHTGHPAGSTVLRGLLAGLAIAPVVGSLQLRQARLRAALRAANDLQQAAQARQERLALALRSGDLTVFDWQLTTGDVQWHAESGALKGAAGRVDAATWRERVHPEDLADALDVLTQHLRGLSPPYERSYRLRAHSGEWRWCRERGQVTERNALGRAVRVVGSIMDITRKREEEARAAASEDLLRSVLDLLPIGVFWKDPDGRYLGANQAFLDHYALDHVIGRQDADFVDAATAEVYRAHDRAVLEGRLEERNALRTRQGAAGAMHWYTSSKVPLRDEHGRTVGVLGTFDDVTAMKQTEQTLRETSERFELALQGSNDGLWDWDLDTNEVYYSPRFKALLGYAEDEYGKDFSVYEAGLHPQDRTRVLAALTRHLQQGEEFDMEYRLRHRDGEWRWYRTRGLVVRDASGVGRRMAGTLSDITERKARELEISEARMHLSDAIEATASAIVMFDARQRLVFCNSRYREFYDLPADLVRPGVAYRELMAAFCELYPGMQQGRTLEAYADELFVRHRAGGKPWELQLPERWLLISERPTQDGGVVCQHTDITGQKAIQRDLEQALDLAETANRAKSQFVANVSHELRTPLNGVLGMLQLLADGNLHAPQDEYVRIALQSGTALLNLINDVLDFSKADAGAAELGDEAFSLPLLIDEVVAASARRAQAKHLRLLPFVDPAVPGRLQGDPSRLAQVLANLLGNAIKFTERGEIRVEARPDPEVLGGVRLIVDDTGVGIPREAQATIFDPFTQIDGSSTRRHGGTGLGLALVRQQVELMGGRLKLESAPGSGSRFEFTLVLRQAGADAPPPPQTVLLAAGPSPYRAALVACLQRAGAQLSVASTGEVASRVTGPLDAMLIDTAWPADEQDALARSAAACGARLAAIVIDADSVPAPMLAASALVRIHAPIAFAAVSDFLHPRASAAGGLPARSQHVLESVVESLQECLGGPAFAALVDTFCETVSQRLADYREAVASGDRERLQQLTHALKGVTANVGAQRLATLCAALGQQGEDGPLEDGHDLLVAEFAAVVKQLRAIAADAPPRQRALV